MHNHQTRGRKQRRISSAKFNPDLHHAKPNETGTTAPLNDMARTGDGRRGNDSDKPKAMASYSNNSLCFAHGSPVLLDTGASVAIENLSSGTGVYTMAGSRRVVGLLRTYVENEVLCELNGILVSAWHPVSFDGVTWYFPVLLTINPVLYTGDIYSVLLEADGSPSAHAVQVGGLWGACLGHGITQNDTGMTDVRAHAFFGDYIAVCDSMAVLRTWNGAYQCYGVDRDKQTGLVRGFRNVKAEIDAMNSQPYHSAPPSGLSA